VKTCKECRRQYNPATDPDPCLGYLPGVVFACCGHGNKQDMYIAFENGVVIRGYLKQQQNSDSDKKHRLAGWRPDYYQAVHDNHKENA